MNVETSIGLPVSDKLISNYFSTLVNQVFKILPMRELSQPSLPKYIWRLEAELIGNRMLLPSVHEDSYFASLLGILHYLGECGLSCQPGRVKQLVFEAINICEKLKARYSDDSCEEAEE